MRRFILAAFAIAFTVSLSVPLKAQGAPPQGGAGQPYVIEYYYKCQWGHQEEFLKLFLHLPEPLIESSQKYNQLRPVFLDKVVQKDKLLYHW